MLKAFLIILNLLNQQKCNCINSKFFIYILRIKLLWQIGIKNIYILCRASINLTVTFLVKMKNRQFFYDWYQFSHILAILPQTPDMKLCHSCCILGGLVHCSSVCGRSKDLAAFDRGNRTISGLPNRLWLHRRLFAHLAGVVAA